MGLDKGNLKKAFLRLKHPDAHSYYSSDKKAISEELKKVNGIKKQQQNGTCVVFDMSINFEQAMGIMSELNKEQPTNKSPNKVIESTKIAQNRSKYVFDLMVSQLTGCLSNPKVDIAVIVFDLHYRPGIKDVDVNRRYDNNAKIFTEIDKGIFPIHKDHRLTKLRGLKSIVKKMKALKNKIANDISKKRKMNSKAKRKGSSYYKRKKKIKSLKTERKNVKKNIKKVKAQRKKLETTIENNPIESWIAGKGNVINRGKVYKVLLSHFKEYAQEKLMSHQLLLVDGFPTIENDIFKRYNSKLYQKNGVDQSLQIQEFESCSLGEGEQSVFYYIERLKWSFKPDKMKKNFVKLHKKVKEANLKLMNFFIYTIDSDILAYTKLKWGISLNDINTWVRFKNFRAISDKVKIERGIESTQENSCKMYCMNVNMISSKIKRLYPNVTHAVELIGSFEILQGCDFIRDFHKFVQFRHSSKGKGNQESKDLIRFFYTDFMEELNSINEKPFIFIDKIPMTELNGKYLNNVFYYVRIDILKMVSRLIVYRKEHSENKRSTESDEFTDQELFKLISFILNLHFICMYIINQSRATSYLDRIKMFANPTSVDSDGKTLFGFRRNEETGIISQSIDIPLEYKKRLIKIAKNEASNILKSNETSMKKMLKESSKIKLRGFKRNADKVGGKKKNGRISMSHINLQMLINPLF